MQDPPERPGAIFPPPLIGLGALLAAIALEQFVPLPAPAPLAPLLGAALALSGLGIAAWGRMLLARANTTLNPAGPTTALVIAGPFRFTRNPLYVGLLCLLAGLSLLAGTWWGIILLLPAFLLLHVGVVLREETYLERLFGPDYLAYKHKVRRWL